MQTLEKDVSKFEICFCFQINAQLFVDSRIKFCRKAHASVTACEGKTGFS
jgi:hypothetical protein